MSGATLWCLEHLISGPHEQNSVDRMWYWGLRALFFSVFRTRGLWALPWLIQSLGYTYYLSLGIPAKKAAQPS